MVCTARGVQGALGLYGATTDDGGGPHPRSACAQFRRAAGPRAQPATAPSSAVLENAPAGRYRGYSAFSRARRLAGFAGACYTTAPTLGEKRYLIEIDRTQPGRLRWAGRLGSAGNQGGRVGICGRSCRDENACWACGDGSAPSHNLSLGRSSPCVRRF